MRNLLKITLGVFLCFGAKAQVAPTSTILSLGSLKCTSIPCTFSASTSPSVLSYTWSILPSKGYSSISDLNKNTVNFTFTANLTYTLSLSVSDGTLSSSTQTIISINKLPKSAFNASLNASGFPNQLILTNFSSNASSYSWVYSDESVGDSSANAVKNYSAPGNYNVALIARGLKGCNDTSHYAFELPKTSSIVLPNIFTPNNDNVNEIYRPFVVGISNLNARVYNRYGLIVASWDKVNGFWDGYTTSGEECSAGQYFIVVEALGFDGQSYKLKAGITLMR